MPLASHDLDYYRYREASERDLARRCDNPAIRRIHAEMAERYAALIDEGERRAIGPASVSA